MKKLPVSLYKQLRNELLKKYQYKIIDGKTLSSVVENTIKNDFTIIRNQLKNISIPTICIIQIGNKQQSNIYIDKKISMCKTLNFNYVFKKYDENICQNDIIDYIAKLNLDDKINGIIVQLPLPPHLDNHKFRILNSIKYSKDIDGITALSIGNVSSLKISSDDKLMNFSSLKIDKNEIFCLVPPTSLGVVEMVKLAHCFDNNLDKYKSDFNNLNICNFRHTTSVVLGRSLVAGAPIFTQMKLLDSTVSLCHSKTKNIESLTKYSDIVISAVGKPNLIDSKMIKNDSIIIDVGINVINDEEDDLNLKYKNNINGNSNGNGNNVIVGDVNFIDVIEKCKYISPVPNGVGRMTVIMLMVNLYRAWKYQNQ